MKTYKVSYDVTEDESQTDFVVTFTVKAESSAEATKKAGDLLYGAFLTSDYTFDWEFPSWVVVSSDLSQGV